VFHRNDERDLPEGYRTAFAVVRSVVADSLCGGDFIPRSPQAKAENRLMRQRLRAMIRKEFLQAFRDPRMRGMLVLPPLIQLLVFGYAANLDVNTARIAWMDQDQSPQSRELLSHFLGSGRFIIAATPASEAEMQDGMDRGSVDGVIRVLPGFARDIERGRPTS